MVKINKTLEYALITLRHLYKEQKKTEHTKRITAKDIAKSYHIPYEAIAKVMQKLAKKKILKSEQGIYGGYFLENHLEGLTLYDLNEALLGPLEIVKCLKSKKLETTNCSIESTCNIINPMKEINHVFKNFFKKINLINLITASSKK